MYKMLRNFGTMYPDVANLVSKYAGDFKVKTHEMSRQNLFALRNYRAKCRGGGQIDPPPVGLGLKIYGMLVMLNLLIIIISWE